MGTNTGIGIGIGIPFKNNALGGDRPYLPLELKARLIGVWDNYGKKNTDADRNIIKNKIPNAGGDLEILNAAYEGMSGYNGYPVIFGINKTWRYEAPSGGSSYIYTINDNKYNFTQIYVVNAWAYSYIKQNGELTDYNKDVTSFKIKVTGLEPDKFLIKYNYLSSTDATVTSNIVISSDGIYELPKSFANDGSLIDNYGWVGFGFAKRSTDIPNTITGVNVTIEVLPEYEGAFVTDGVNDVIVSQNTVEEMGITDEVTVVSMIHQIDLNSTYTIATTNYIENSNSREHVRSDVYNYGKTGIYGYSASLINNTKSDIKNILGDEADYYVKSTNSLQTIFDAKFSVVGRISELTEASQVVWYWTFIAKRVLTTDEINQVIAYFNLDKTLKPDILCNITKQGITNDNHADFNDKLIDYSGNGRDLQLFNIGWKGESGVGRYTEEFKNDYWLVHKDQTGIIKDGNSIKVVGKLSNYYIVYHSRLKATNGFKVKIKGIKTEIIYNYISSDKEQSISFKEDGIYDIPASEAVDSTFTLGFYFRYNDINLDWTGLTIEIIPSNKGALCLDGINDFGKVINMPIYKDYTFIIDREILSIDNIGIIASKSESAEDATKHGAFIFEYLTAPNIINTWSYYKNNTNIANTDFIRGISYQSKYNYNGKDLIIGTSKDSDKLYLGTIRDNSDKYGNIAIYFLMSFPYSMNKFLIERQLKKYKAGTLYKDMVEFRPVIKSNIDIKNIVYLDKDSNVVKVGDYISIGSNIKTSITVLDGYKISKVSSTAFNNITIEKSNTDFIYDVIFYGIKKSPQKINLVIEQDSDYVQWNPNIKANVSKYSVTANIRETDGTTLKLVNGQFYSTSITGNLILDIVPPYKDSDEVTNVVIDGKSYVPTKDSSGNYYRLEIPLVFPKEINITIQEYVRYEDIVQPYPVLLRFKDENNNEISWGDKIKLGSNITRIGSFNDCNLLKDIYTVSNAKLNGNPLPNTPHVVERQMVFTCTATWIFDDNEPNCILSPRLLRIPNSSYKILRHIPDISGHGNHGVIHNSAYALNSGANGYPYDYSSSSFTVNTNLARKLNGEKVEYFAIGISEGFIYNDKTYKGKVKITGVSKAISNNEIYNFRIYSNTSEHIESSEYITITEDGIYDIDIKGTSQDSSKVNFFAVTKLSDVVKLKTPITIEQIGEYEGAFCLDGVNDFIEIPTTVGGKQVLMKVNWQKQDTMLYNQNPGQDNFAIFTNDYNNNNLVVAYASRNNGNTYIDGVVNNNILATQLKGITHNIVATNNNIDTTITPIIGSNKNHDNFFAQMSLYDFMLFDEISTDDKIKELNTYIGITPKVTLPNYYWDNYGKKNTDAKRGYIDEQVSLQKTGTSVNPLENFNISYEGMSGYNGYPVVFGAKKTWETSNAVDYIYDINSTIVHITNVKHAANGLLYSYVKRDGALANIKEIPAFRVTVKGLEKNSKLIYKYLATENATKESIVYLGNGIHKLPKSFVPTEALLDLTTNSWIGFAITPMIEGELVFDCDITIEILPEYENSLVYDGVSDFTDNKNIPIFTDFTAIIKRVDLDAKNNNSTVMFKGNKIYESNIGNGFILDYCYNSKNYVYSYGKLNQIERDDSKIIYLTPESYNGNSIIKGENEDNLGLVLGKYWKGIIYKTILYSKTISLLEINFLKNLMEKDEIIDINHPIFISNTEDENNASQDT